jgi:hypothetical protein
MKVLKENENKEMRGKYGEGSDKTSFLCLTKKRGLYVGPRGQG